MILSACGDASAATVDSSDDVHCSVVVFYFKGLAAQQGAPPDQLHAVGAVHEWYAARLRATAAQRWQNMDRFAEEIDPLLEAVERDPHAMSDELEACTSRAVEDPGFNAYLTSRSS